jgi:hypothetical protein
LSSTRPVGFALDVIGWTPVDWYGYASGPATELSLAFALLDFRKKLRPLDMFFLKKLFLMFACGVAGALGSLLFMFVFIIDIDLVNLKIYLYQLPLLSPKLINQTIK